LRLLRRARPNTIASLVVAVTFSALLISAGLRATPGVLMIPLERFFGWDRATISLSAAVGISLYGLTGPFAASLMQSIGIRRTMLGGLALMAGSTFASLWMTQPWQYVVTWGIVSGSAPDRRVSTGRGRREPLVREPSGPGDGPAQCEHGDGCARFLSLLACLSREGNWRPTVTAVSIACAALIPVVALLIPEHPGDVGTRRFGERDYAATTVQPSRHRC
jgi:hypothetical protein